VKRPSPDGRRAAPGAIQGIKKQPRRRRRSNR